MTLNGNWVDLVIIIVLIYFATEAFRHGFWVILADFTAFLGSLLISLKFYKNIAEFLELNFNLAGSTSNAFGFLISAILIESVLGFLLGHLIVKIPKKLRTHKLNRYLGIIPGLGEGIILISFLLTLIIALPLRPQIKEDVSQSKIGSYIVEKTSGVEHAINDVFGGVLEESLTYFTIKPGTNESVPLEIAKIELSVDEVAETALFNKVNEERRKLAIPELVWAPEIVPVGRAHARDMWERKYFSHYSPEGRDVGDRLKEYGIDYSFAGENLALAPTVATAHNGLMNSQGHRENILESRFTKMGIGVIDNGIYGKMFVQVFTN
jgi:uncharacterized protein YkwD